MSKFKYSDIIYNDMVIWLNFTINNSKYSIIYSSVHLHFLLYLDRFSVFVVYRNHNILAFLDTMNICSKSKLVLFHQLQLTLASI